ncbi:5'-nucleotidase [Pseudonocardia thermophila]|uniref:5'-nucleotidase n=1 Tax=Pseudonocardia thermophila TaxID=1848 RepID=A0A1M6UKA3_PSETH|nr:5'-nucleotidase [Pseudonocardia thermophila]
MITNDDGIDSPGLWVLAAAARDAGFEVTVAAPHVDTSGAGASVLAVRDDDGHVRVHRRDRDGITGYAVEGHPAFIALSVARGWLGPPDVLLSGINLGTNTGRAVLHSGTVGAALTAGLAGIRALAVSQATGWPPSPNPRWDTAASVVPGVLDSLLAAPEGTVLSLNVPDLPADELGPLREAALAPAGAVQVRVTEGDGLLRTEYAGSGPVAEDTDVALLAAGHPTVTSLTAITAVPGLFTSL